jgi:hypothetical protein
MQTQFALRNSAHSLMSRAGLRGDVVEFTRGSSFRPFNARFSSYVLGTASCRSVPNGEEVMRFTKSTSLVLALAITAVSSAAFAADQDSEATCAATGKQVSSALSSQDNDAARQEKKMGLEFCNAGYYHQGMEHYAKALEMLGVKN